MKGTFALIVAIIALAVSCICGYMIEKSYNLHNAETGSIPLSAKQTEQVKEYIVEFYDSLQNPAFTTVKEVFDFYNSQETQENLVADFKAIPVDVLVNVAQVCLDDRPYVRLSDIVNSYKEHQAVYEKLTSTGVIQDVESLADRPSESNDSTNAIISIITQPDTIQKE